MCCSAMVVFITKKTKNFQLHKLYYLNPTDIVHFMIVRVNHSMHVFIYGVTNRFELTGYTVTSLYAKKRIFAK